MKRREVSAKSEGYFCRLFCSTKQGAKIAYNDMEYYEAYAIGDTLQNIFMLLIYNWSQLVGEFVNIFCLFVYIIFDDLSK